MEMTIILGLKIALTVFFILKVLGIILGVGAFIWGFLKFFGEEKTADVIDDAGGKIIDNIIEPIIKYSFYAIVIIIIYVVATNL